MILRRLATAFRKQDWFTIAVDRERLLNDPSMMTALQNAYGAQDNVHRLLTNTGSQVRDALEQIRAERERLG